MNSVCLSVVTLAFTLVLSLASPPPGNNGRVLVLVDDMETVKTHSKLLKSLSVKGFHTEFFLVEDEKASLLVEGDYAYDNLLLLCPQAKRASRGVSSTQITRFLESGRNLFLTADSDYGGFTKQVATSIGVDMDERGAKAIDHQHVYEAHDNGDHTFITAGGMSQSKFLFGDAQVGTVVFSGAGASLFADNELVDPVIWGSSSSYSYKPRTAVKKAPLATGFDTVLGAVLSTRVGSRATYFGGFGVLADAVFDKVDPSHEEALESLLGWTFGHSGVLKWGNIAHERMDRSVDGGMTLPNDSSRGYRIKDRLKFSIDVEAWDGTAGMWVPYKCDDMQLEFTMLNPYIRTRLRTNGEATYSASIVVPDRIGIYKFVIEYWRVGVSPILVKEVVPVRPFAHNEYERFIGQAVPYYASSLSMLVGVFLLGIAFLYGGSVHRPRPVSVKEHKKRR